MTFRTAFIAVALITALTLPGLANAQDRLSRTELTAITTEQTQSLTDLKTRSEQLQVQNADLALKLRELEAENAQLNGRIETLQFQLGQSRDEVISMREDDQEIGRQLASFDSLINNLTSKVSSLETRLAQREQVYRITEGQLQASTSGAPQAEASLDRVTVTGSRISRANTTSVSPVTAVQAESLPQDADALFQNGKAQLLRFDYAGAERSFSTFLQRFGSNAQAGEAQYWLGEVLYQQKSYAESGAAYTDMVRKFPTHANAPDALVKLGRSLRLVGDTERACAILATLPTRYPDASPVTRNLASVERSRSSCSP